MESHWDVTFYKSGEVLFYYSTATHEVRWSHVADCSENEQERVPDKAELAPPDEHGLEDKDGNEVQELEDNNDLESAPCIVEGGEVIQPVVDVVGCENINLENKRLLNRNCRSPSFTLEKEDRTKTSDILSFKEINIDSEGGIGAVNQLKNCDTRSELHRTNNTATSFESPLTSQERMQTNEKVFHCTQRKSNSESAILEYKVRTCNKEKPCLCKECSKCFRSRSHLTEHIREHSGETPRKCKHCGQWFSDASNLTKHLLKHSGQPPFKCKQCGKCCRDTCDLTKHVRIHSGEKPYKCKQCGKSFSDPSNRTKHVRSHTGAKPFQCELCSKFLSTADSLTKHLRIHTGEKPYKCKQCEECFRHSNTLLKHNRTHPG